MRSFEDFWFSTGTPTFLLKLLKERSYSLPDLKNQKLSIDAFNKFDLNSLELNSLLFQTGYLTLKAYDRVQRLVTRDFPNKEVENSFLIYLLAELSEKGKEVASGLLYEIAEAMKAGRVEKFIELMRAMLKNITYPNIENTEKYYHTIFYLCLKPTI